MKNVQFNSDWTSQKSGAAYKKGERHSLRDDLARLLYSRDIIFYVTEPVKEIELIVEKTEVENGDKVESAVVVQKSDSGDTSQRTVNVPKGRPRGRTPSKNSRK
jgi:hypothetical protein